MFVYDMLDMSRGTCMACFGV